MRPSGLGFTQRQLLAHMATTGPVILSQLWAEDSPLSEYQVRGPMRGLVARGLVSCVRTARPAMFEISVAGRKYLSQPHIAVAQS